MTKADSAPAVPEPILLGPKRYLLLKDFYEGAMKRIHARAHYRAEIAAGRPAPYPFPDYPPGADEVWELLRGMKMRFRAAAQANEGEA